MHPLWPNQEQCLIEVPDAINRGVRRMIVCSPTGGGKGRMICELFKWATGMGWAGVCYTNRKLLTEQLEGVLARAGISCGVRAAGHPDNRGERVQISSVPTEGRRTIDRQRWMIHGVGQKCLVVFDEGHLMTGRTARALMQMHMDAGHVVVLFTATPLGMSDVADELTVAGTTSELRACGALVPAVHYAPTEPMPKRMRLIEPEELSPKEEKESVDCKAVWGHVLEWWRKLNPEGKPTILFGPGVAESAWFAQEFYKAGVPAAHIDGEQVWWNGKWYKSEPVIRQDIRDASLSGDLKVVANRFVLREGIDWPWLTHGIFATAFGSLQTYLQSGGRLLRAYPGKEKAVIQDHGGCLDTRCEVLTKSGWVGIDDMSDAMTIGTMNLSTGKFEWQPNQGTIRKAKDSPMYSTRCRHLDFRVTAYHEMVMRADLRRGEWKKVRADELAARRSNWIIPVSAVEDMPPSPLTDHEIAFIGWYLTDGCMDGARIRIYQSRVQPASHHQHIINTLEGCGFRYTVKERVRPSPFTGEESREVVYSVQSGRKSDGGWDRLSPWVRRHKVMSQCFEDFDSRQLGVLLFAMNLGDGLKHRTYNQKTIEIAISDRLAADRLQSLCVRRGYRCNLSEQVQWSNTFKRQTIIYILRIRKCGAVTVSRDTFTGDTSGKDSDRVWCVQTANGTIFVRRNGKVCVMGNSWWRYGSLNADRHWELEYTDRIAAGLRWERLRAGDDPEPYRCYGCGRVCGGGRCPACGDQPQVGRRVRKVLQSDGSLVEVTGRIFHPRRTVVKDDTKKNWVSCYYAARHSKRPMTFAQAYGWFTHKWGYYPPRDLAYMPKRELDWYRHVSEVNYAELHSGSKK